MIHRLQIWQKNFIFFLFMLMNSIFHFVNKIVIFFYSFMYFDFSHLGNWSKLFKALEHTLFRFRFESIDFLVIWKVIYSKSFHVHFVENEIHRDSFGFLQYWAQVVVENISDFPFHHLLNQSSEIVIPYSESKLKARKNVDFIYSSLVYRI